MSASAFGSSSGNAGCSRVGTAGSWRRAAVRASPIHDIALPPAPGAACVMGRLVAASQRVALSEDS